MTKRIWILFIFMLLPWNPAKAATAHFSFSGPSTATLGQTIQVTVKVQAAEDADTFRLNGKFSGEMLTWQSAIPASGFNSSPGNFFDQQSGRFSFGGFRLGNSIRGDASLVTLVFKTKQAGKATILLESGSRLLSAGKDQALGVSPYELLIKAPSPAESQPSFPLSRITLSSPTHPDETQWYSDDQVRVRWTFEGKSPRSVLIGLDQSPTGQAKTPTSSQEAGFSIPNDGIWYIHVSAKDENGLVHEETYRLQVDREPPRTFVPTFDQTPGSAQIPNVVRFGTLDAEGGIVTYDVSIDGVFVTSTRRTFLYLPSLDAGEHDLLIRASDQAGNSTDIHARFHVSRPSSALFSLPTPTRSWMKWVFLGGMASCLLFLFLFILKRRRKENEQEGSVHTLSTDEKKIKKIGTSTRRLKTKK